LALENLVHEADLEKKKQILLLRNLYRSFVDNTFEFIFRSSPGTDKILFSNNLFIKNFEFESYKQAKGFLLKELFETPTDYSKLKDRILKEHQIRQVPVNFKSRTGKRIVSLVNAQTQINELGQLVINWIALDISERVEFENNLEQKNVQLAKVNSQMEKFLYSTSHDLRAPLTSILGIVNLVRMESSDKSVVEYVNKIESRVIKLDQIIRDIINFSKTTYKNIHSGFIDLESLVWKIVNSYHDDKNFARIKVTVAVSGDAKFYSDMDRIEIILDNLIRNAIQFVDVNKVKPFLNINIELLPESVSIDIHDNGIGIARQYFEQIFNMFFKASLQSKGAGLGLYIAKEGVEQLAGTMTLESEVGFGSVFKVFIPNSAKGRLINKKRKLENSH